MIKETSFQGIFNAELKGNNIVTFNGNLKYVGNENSAAIKHSPTIISVVIKNSKGKVIFTKQDTNYTEEKTFQKNELLKGQVISTKLNPGKYRAEISINYLRNNKDLNLSSYVDLKSRIIPHYGVFRLIYNNINKIGG